MDDFNISSLYESKNEWAARLVNILTPLFIEGLKSILESAVKMCQESGEKGKQLMTFQNLLIRTPKWNNHIIEIECSRIIEKSGCTYLDDLISCIHIIQLKILTSVRVGQKQKKINIAIPKLPEFVHKCYINIARKIYTNMYLFETAAPSLQIQKNNRELEIIVQECILNTIRDNIPVESILRAYMDETVEEEVDETVVETTTVNTPEVSVVETGTGTQQATSSTQSGGNESGQSSHVSPNATPMHLPTSSGTASPVQLESVAAEKFPIDTAEFTNEIIDPYSLTGNNANSYSPKNLSFNDTDVVLTSTNQTEHVSVPKDVHSIEEANAIKHARQQLEDDMDSNNDEKLVISNTDIDPESFSFESLDNNKPSSSSPSNFNEDLDLNIEILH